MATLFNLLKSELMLAKDGLDAATLGRVMKAKYGESLGPNFPRLLFRELKKGERDGRLVKTRSVYQHRDAIAQKTNEKNLTSKVKKDAAVIAMPVVSAVAPDTSSAPKIVPAYKPMKVTSVKKATSLMNNKAATKAPKHVAKMLVQGKGKSGIDNANVPAKPKITVRPIATMTGTNLVIPKPTLSKLVGVTKPSLSNSKVKIGKASCALNANKNATHMKT